MELIFIILSSSSLIHSSAPFILLLILSSVFFISGFELFTSVCLFFTYSSSLLNISCIFLVYTSILFLRSWIIFTIITLNSFLGRLPVSTSLSFSSGVLSCSFVCTIFLCRLILPNFLWLWFLLCRLQGCSSSCFCCLPLGGWGWSNRLLQAPWWEGLFPAHWWVELGLVPLMGRAMSRGLFRGGCALWTSLGRLSADGWVYVPTLFVVWPEASQHWSLQAVGWGQILLRKWQPPGGLTAMSTPELLPPGSLSPQMALPPQETLQYQQVSLAPGFYEVTAFSPGSWCSQDVVVCTLKEWSFCFPQSCGIPVIKPHWPSKPDALGASPSDARPPGLGAWCRAQNFHSCGATSAI